MAPRNSGRKGSRKSGMKGGIEGGKSQKACVKGELKCDEKVKIENRRLRRLMR